MYLEDGLRVIYDHRNGNVLFPTTLVTDELKTLHLGIADDAPWWWPRRGLWRDLQPDGKDAHGHEAYKIWENKEREGYDGCCEKVSPPLGSVRK